MECRMRVNDVFCDVSSNDKMRSVTPVLLEKKPPLAATQAFSLRDPGSTHLLKHPTAACPRSVIHVGQTCPQFCGIGRSWTLNELCLRRQVLILHLWEGPRNKNVKRKATTLPQITCFAGQCSRLNVLLDAAAAALDA